MLKSNDIHKIEIYIDKLIDGIRLDAKKSMQNMSYKQIINKVIVATVNKFTPESKMILSSVYNMMMERTLSEPLYENVQNKAAFYEMDILKDLNSKFNFDIPQKIDYQESKVEINKWIKAGAVVVVGGVISIPLKSWIPIGIAVIIAGIMAFILKDDTDAKKQNIDSLIDEYLENVKKSLLRWVDSIAAYYDEKVSELERKLVNL